MHNLRTVINFEFSRTIRRKAFWVSTLAIPALIGIVIAISFFSSKTANTATEQADKQHFSLAVLDESHLVSPAILQVAGAQSVADKQTGINLVASGHVQAFFFYPPDPTKTTIEVYARDLGLVKNSQYTDVATQLLQASVTASIGSPEKIALINTAPNTQLTVYAHGQPVDDGADRLVAPGLFLVLFYLVIILLGNQMLSSTTEEKENRVIEMMFTTISSTALIVGKIIAMMEVGLLQIAVILVPTLLAYDKLRGSLSLPDIDLTKIAINPAQMLMGAFLFIGGFLIFTGVLVAVGAAMPTAKEANRFFGVAMFSMFIPLYAAAAIVTSPSEPIVQIFSYFPLTAPITLLLRNAVGNLSPLQDILAVVTITLSAVLALVIAIQSFRFGALQYSRKLSLREVFSGVHVRAK